MFETSIKIVDFRSVFFLLGNYFFLKIRYRSDPKKGKNKVVNKEMVFTIGFLNLVQLFTAQKHNKSVTEMKDIIRVLFTL